MTRYEKVSVILSLAAMLLSVCSPILMYSWLDPTLKAFGLRGRLQVSSSKDKDRREFHNEVIRAIIMDDLEVPNIKFDVEIQNVGELPASGIQIVVQYADQAKDGGVTFEPPVQFEATYRGTQTFISLRRALAPRDKLRITLTDNPSKILVSNEFGETSIVDTDLGWFRTENTIRDMLKDKAEKERRRGSTTK